MNYSRLLSGKTQKQVGELLDCGASNLRYIELGRRNPQDGVGSKIEEYFRSAVVFGSSVWDVT